MLRRYDPLVYISLAYVESVESIKSSNTVSVVTFSGFLNSDMPLTNKNVFQVMQGFVPIMTPHCIFKHNVTKLLPALRQTNCKRGFPTTTGSCNV